MSKATNRDDFNEELFRMLIELEGYAHYEIEEFYFHLSEIVEETECIRLKSAFKAFILETKLSDSEKKKMIHELHFILEVLNMKGWSY